jgi:hypothetical protein
MGGTSIQVSQSPGCPGEARSGEGGPLVGRVPGRLEGTEEACQMHRVVIRITLSRRSVREH